MRKEPSVDSVLPHKRPHIPDTELLVPPDARAPPLAPEQAPVDAGDELGVVSHAAQLRAHDGARGAGAHVVCGCVPAALLRPVAPDAARHVVAGAEEEVREVRRPRQLADGVVVADHGGQRALLGRADVEGADRAVDARHGHHRRAVLVPVVRQGLGGRRGRGGRRHPGLRGGHHRRRGAVDGDLHGEMVRRGGRSAQVEHAHVRVGRDARQEIGGVRREGSRVGAAVRGQGQEGGRAFGRPDLDGAVPAAGAEAVLGDQVPVHGEDLAVVLAPVLHGEVVERAVEQLDAAVARGHQHLVLVDLGPGEVVEGVLGREPAGGYALAYLSIRGYVEVIGVGIHTTSAARSRWA